MGHSNQIFRKESGMHCQQDKKKNKKIRTVDGYQVKIHYCDKNRSFVTCMEEVIKMTLEQSILP